MKVVKIPICLFILTLFLCPNCFAQTDKETEKRIARRLEAGEKTFRISAAGEPREIARGYR